MRNATEVCKCAYSRKKLLYTKSKPKASIEPNILTLTERIIHGRSKYKWHTKTQMRS